MPVDERERLAFLLRLVVRGFLREVLRPLPLQTLQRALEHRGLVLVLPKQRVDVFRRAQRLGVRVRQGVEYAVHGVRRLQERELGVGVFPLLDPGDESFAVLRRELRGELDDVQIAARHAVGRVHRELRLFRRHENLSDGGSRGGDGDRPRALVGGFRRLLRFLRDRGGVTPRSLFLERRDFALVVRVVRIGGEQKVELGVVLLAPQDAGFELGAVPRDELRRLVHDRADVGRGGDHAHGVRLRLELHARTALHVHRAGLQARILHHSRGHVHGRAHLALAGKPSRLRSPRSDRGVTRRSARAARLRTGGTGSSRLGS